MSPRPRTVPDEVILEATARVIGRLGPARFTLADVGAEVGLSAATLVQRFGTKRGLLLALARSAVDFVNDCFVTIRARYASPLAALLSAATQMASQVDSPEELANNLAFLQLDLSDPEFHQLALESSRLIRAGYRALIDDAMAAGELEPCDSTRLASAIDATAGGSLIAWAIHREGDVKAFVRKDLETLLAPYRRHTAKRPARR
ncbi:MAG TPA: helix-turn-helix domain-containing protein [Gemmatimonadaceae bacterium]|nr:helix-turn-helix domain-containing protein [Gemmatimonadaceae bacterium]